MFHKPKKRQKGLNDLIKIVSPQQLLKDEKRSELMEKIQGLCALNSERYDSLCLSLIHTVLAYCQNLPDSSLNFYAQLGGLVEHSLRRTEAALRLFQIYLIPDENNEFSEEQKLWQYVLFSAALIQGLGKLVVEYKIEIFDQNAYLLNQWQPLTGDLLKPGTHYSYELLKEAAPGLKHSLNILMAHILMPEAGFAWISSQQQTLVVWLALLNEDLHAAGTLGSILGRANSLVLHYLLNLLKPKGPEGPRHSPSFIDRPDNINQLEQQLGLQFLHWLYQALEAGTLIINKDNLFLMDEGLLLCPEIFQAFIRDQPQIKNWQVVRQGFLSLGLHRIAPNGSVIARYELINQQRIHSGVIFQKFGMVMPGTVQYLNLHTQKVASLNAMELEYQGKPESNPLSKNKEAKNGLQYLNPQGKWQTSNNSFASKLKLPMKPGGGGG